jgi:hypothetical protein
MVVLGLGADKDRRRRELAVTLLTQSGLRQAVPKPRGGHAAAGTGMVGAGLVAGLFVYACWP